MHCTVYFKINDSGYSKNMKVQRLSQNTIKFLDTHLLRHLPEFSGSWLCRAFWDCWKRAQTSLYNNLWGRYSSFSKISYDDPWQINIRENNLIHHYLPIHCQFSWFVLSQNTDTYSQCRGFILSARFTLIVFPNLAWGRLLKKVWTSLITLLFDSNW